MKRACLFGLWAGWALALGAAEKEPAPAPMSVRELAKRAGPAVAVISHFGRDGIEDGVGTGFVVSANGLIATSLHVIGEARRITVRLGDGKEYEVTGIHAWDRSRDLAVIRVAAEDLPALELGDSDTLEQGTAVVAMGNPMGLEKSIVSGVVSATREFDGLEMIQLAIPIEQGNSGGPLMDMRGRVHGLLNMKSAVTANLGFATPINALKPLLEKPNPVTMARWLTVGGLNSDEWQVVMGANWRRKSGRLLVEGMGTGFGGRSLCLYEGEVPDPPYEVEVMVRLKDEAGAAGLVFASDGDQRHYGFYPSAGNMRLTRFDGPSVFTWDILEQGRSDAYRLNQWNHIRVRREERKTLCYVNGDLVFESEDRGLTGGRVGLAKFRDTVAEFKGFRLGTNLVSLEPSAKLVGELKQQIERLSQDPEALTEVLSSHAGLAESLLTERVRELEEEAAELRRVSAGIHNRAVQSEMLELFREEESKIDLFHAALLIAKLDSPGLDLETYQRQLEGMAAQILEELPGEAGDEERIRALTRHLFEENGFHGSRHDYYNRANSYMTDVLDDREGLPISLSVLFMELGRRIGLETIRGVGLPGHFVVKHSPEGGPERLIDPFEGGALLTIEAAAERLSRETGLSWSDDYLEATTKRQIIVRMLRNLLGIAVEEEHTADALRYLDLILALEPESGGDRTRRALLRLQNEDKAGARSDLERVLEQRPEEIDLERIEGLYRSLF